MVFTFLLWICLFSSDGRSYAAVDITRKRTSGRVYMTANQIAYIQATESARHNLASEAELRRSNLANEAIGRRNAASNEKNAETSNRNSWWQNVLNTIF